MIILKLKELDPIGGEIRGGLIVIRRYEKDIGTCEK